MALLKKMQKMTNEFMDQIFNETGLPVLIYDSKGYIIRCNEY